MILTLYSNCRLNSHYDYVIQNAYLEGYLARLTSTELQIDDVYLTDKGKFHVDMNATYNILPYNYFKIYDSVNKITRYYFIDDINIVNGVAIIEYTEDVWSSYSSAIVIERGEVSHLRYGTINALPRLPVDYVSNDRYNITKLNVSNSISTPTDDKVMLVLTLSFYNLEQSGDPTYRFFKSFIVTIDDELPHQTFDVADALEYLKAFYCYSAGGQSFVWTLNDNVDVTFDAYEIVNAYFVPSGLVNETKGFKVQDYYTEINLLMLDEEHALPVSTHFYLRQLKSVDETLYADRQLAVDYKHYAIGTLDNLIMLDNNGTKTKWNIRWIITDYELAIYLMVGTNIINLMPSFSITLPISVQGADVTQQQQIARELKNNSIQLSNEQTTNKATLNYIKSGLGAVGGVASIMSGNVLGGIMSIGSSGLSATETALDKKYTLAQNDLSKWANNQPMYQTNSIIKVPESNIAIATTGLILVDVVPDNETYVNAVIESIGYKVSKIVADSTLITTAQESQTHNIVRFSNVRLRGNVPQRILNEFQSILLKGFYIFFTIPLT